MSAWRRNPNGSYWRTAPGGYRAAVGRTRWEVYRLLPGDCELRLVVTEECEDRMEGLIAADRWLHRQTGEPGFRTPGTVTPIPKPEGRRGGPTPPDVHRAVMARALCEVGAAGCTRWAVHAHHIHTKPRVHDPELMLAVCLSCHEHIHRHPEESYERGWLARTNRVEEVRP